MYEGLQKGNVFYILYIRKIMIVTTFSSVVQQCGDVIENEVLII